MTNENRDGGNLPHSGRDNSQVSFDEWLVLVSLLGSSGTGTGRHVRMRRGRKAKTGTRIAKNITSIVADGSAGPCQRANHSQQGCAQPLMREGDTVSEAPKGPTGVLCWRPGENGWKSLGCDATLTMLCCCGRWSVLLTNATDDMLSIRYPPTATSKPSFALRTCLLSGYRRI